MHKKVTCEFVETTFVIMGIFSISSFKWLPDVEVLQTMVSLLWTILNLLEVKVVNLHPRRPIQTTNHQLLLQRLFQPSHQTVRFYVTKVHLFLNQCFAQSSLNSIWRYFRLMSAEYSLKISLQQPQIGSNEDHAKHDFKSKWTLATYLHRVNTH